MATPGRKSRARLMAEQEKTKSPQQSMLPPNFNETPEFQAAVTEAAKTALHTLVAEMKAAQSTDAKPASADGLLSGLALELAELTSQNSGRKYIAPEILRQRAQAGERMMDLIKQASDKRQLPTYRLTNKVHLDDQVVEPFFVGSDHVARPTEIGWPHVPNDAMVPINDVAKEIYAQWLASVGNVEKPVADPKFGVTAKGLVVKGAAVQRKREVGNPQFGQDAMQGTDYADKPSGLTIAHAHLGGQQSPQHILGTIQPPATQYIPGQRQSS